MAEIGIERVTRAARSFEMLLSEMREVLELREQVHRAERFGARVGIPSRPNGAINNNSQKKLHSPAV